MKTTYRVITFKNTTQALIMEKKAKTLNFPGRIIPLPKQIDAGCGLAFSAQEKEMIKIFDFLKEHKIQYEDVCEVTF